MILIDELERIVLYLNQHTADNLQVLALELGYIADHGVEILVSQTYGEESSQPKGITAKQQWDEPKLFTKLASASTPAGIEATRQLYAWTKHRANQLYWSAGSLAWVSGQFLIGGKLVSVISIGEWPEKRGVVSINFEYLRGLVPTETLKRLADRVQSIPGVAEIYATLEAKDFRQRPNLPIDQILIQHNAVRVIEEALNTFPMSSPPQDIPRHDRRPYRHRRLRCDNPVHNHRDRWRHRAGAITPPAAHGATQPFCERSGLSANATRARAGGTARQPAHAD